MEMLVSIVIGMIIVAAASTMLVNVLKSQKDMASSAKLNQELGAVMVVMSNEIRRSGFSYCNKNNFTCSEPPKKYDASDKDINVNSTCIEYRYNAKPNDTLVDPGEKRGFRLEDASIQMAAPDMDVTCGNNTNWVALTDPKVITITALNFSTTGSKCRNMKTGGNSWAVGDVDAGGNIVENSTLDADLACEVIDDNAYEVALYDDVTGVPSSAVFDEDWRKPPTGEGTILFGTRKITIQLQAELTNDSEVSKKLITSVRVSNPLIELIPPSP